jgi:hypothetical protein
MTEQTTGPQRTEPRTGLFLYGIVPADVEPTETANGLGDPPQPVSTIPLHDIAALVSEVPLDQPLGRPQDLLTYQRLLDGTATVTGVLPVRFGTVLSGRDAVIDLLRTHHDDLLAALRQLDGRVEYAVRSRYRDQTLLSEVISENAEVARLREQIANQPEEATLNLRIRLGEIVTQAVEDKRNADTRRLADALAPYAEQVVTLPPAHESDAANVAALVRFQAREAFEAAVRKLTDDWSERADARLLGPLAPYDFATLQHAGG